MGGDENGRLFEKNIIQSMSCVAFKRPTKRRCSKIIFQTSEEQKFEKMQVQG